MARLKNALIVGLLAASSTGWAGASSAWAESPENVDPANASSVTRTDDQFNADDEVIGGSAIIPAGVVTKDEGEGTSTAPSTMVEVGGGTWDYGTSANQGWSNYLHGTKNHGATVSQGSRAVRSDTGPGVWANTTINRDIFSNDPIRAYWRVN
ncbi:lactococcin 972 family bacteriocin [Saccharothrix lopnurensis]|uniref:Lactococcin 972 family bacteriocin n=1 Tax=Saccharothrix lopnurensis TaxID=1670621 RepID=A0ABW1PGX1_9PSEU